MTAKTGSIIIKNSAFLMGGRLISRILQFLLFIYAARILGVEKFGVFSYAFAFTALVTVFMDLGISRYFVQQASRSFEKIPAFMGASFTVKAFLIVVGMIFIIGVGPLFQKDPEIFYVLLILGLTIAMDNLTIVFSSVFQAKEKMEYQSFIIIISNTLMTGIGFALIYYYPGLILYSFVFLIGAVLRFILSAQWCVKKFGLPVWVSDRKFHTDLVKKGLPFALVTVFVSIYYYIDTFLLTIYSGKEIVGYYNASYRLLEAPLFLVSALTTALFPTISRLYGSEKEDLVELIQKIMHVAIVFGLSVSIIVSFLSTPLILLIYGDEYQKSALVLPILIFSVSVIIPNAILGTSIRAMDRQNVSAKLTCAGAVLNVVMNIIVIPRYSFVGAAWTTLATEIFIFAVSVVLVWRYLGPVFNLSVVSRISLFAACMTAFLYATEGAGMWIQIATYSFLFPFMILVFRFLDWKDVVSGFAILFRRRKVAA